MVNKGTAGNKRRPRLWVVSFLVLMAAVGIFAWRRVATHTDMVRVVHANNQGIGYAEQFQWSQASAAFEEVVRLAPEWLPGRINLGIALLNNTDTPGALEKSRALFEKILKQEPKNPYAHFCLGILMRHEGKPEEIDAARARLA